MLTESFFCPICLKLSKSVGQLKGREGNQCKYCFSTSRDRAVIFAVQKIVIKNKLKNKKINRIIGIADSDVVQEILSKRFGSIYFNYNFHKDPYMDITNIQAGEFIPGDIVICSDVLEHVKSPVNMAFIGLNLLLNSGAYLVLSVPHSDLNGKHIEHFPLLQEFKLTKDSPKKIVGRDFEGKHFESTNLTFHGGEGEVLEFRIFSESSLREFLQNNMFNNIKKVENNYLFGFWWEPWSRVWVAQKANN